MQNCQGSQFPQTRGAKPVRIRAGWQNSQKRHARALGGESVVDIVAQIESIARETRHQGGAAILPGPAFPFGDVIERDGAAKDAACLQSPLGVWPAIRGACAL